MGSVLLCMILLLSQAVCSYGQGQLDAKRRDYICAELLKRVPNAKIYEVTEESSIMDPGWMVAIVKYDKTILSPNRYSFKEAVMKRPATMNQITSNASFDYSEMIPDRSPTHVFIDHGRQNATLYVSSRATDNSILALIDHIYSRQYFMNIENKYHQRRSVTAKEIFQSPPRLTISSSKGETIYRLQLDSPWIILCFKQVDETTFELVDWLSYVY